jgi:hypothetical protein
MWRNRIASVRPRGLYWLGGFDLRYESTSFQFLLTPWCFSGRKFPRLRFLDYQQIALTAKRGILARLTGNADAYEGNRRWWSCLRFIAPAWHRTGFYQDSAVV